MALSNVSSMNIIKLESSFPTNHTPIETQDLRHVGTMHHANDTTLEVRWADGTPSRIVVPINSYMRELLKHPVPYQRITSLLNKIRMYHVNEHFNLGRALDMYMSPMSRLDDAQRDKAFHVIWNYAMPYAASDMYKAASLLKILGGYNSAAPWSTYQERLATPRAVIRCISTVNAELPLIKQALPERDFYTLVDNLSLAKDIAVYFRHQILWRLAFTNISDSDVSALRKLFYASGPRGLSLPSRYYWNPPTKNFMVYVDQSEYDADASARAQSRIEKRMLARIHRRNKKAQAK